MNCPNLRTVNCCLNCKFHTNFTNYKERAIYSVCDYDNTFLSNESLAYKVIWAEEHMICENEICDNWQIVDSESKGE